MLRQQRFEKILSLLQQRGSVTVKDVSDTLYISQPTVRRDLSEMHAAGMLIRTHGGALSIGESRLEIPIDLRTNMHMQEKLRLDQAAVKLIKNNSVLYIDASSTALHIINHLQPFENLLVITNSMQASLLLQKYRIHHFCTGGFMIEHSLAYGGHFAEEMARSFNIDLMFFSSSGVNPNGWITDYSDAENHLRHVVLKQSAKSVFLCDHSKFDKTSVYNLVHLSEVDYIITDQPLPRSYQTGKAKCIVA